MRVNIRHQAYETNSSSTHSVVIDPDDALSLDIPRSVLREGVIRAEVFPQGYGWQWHRFYKPENKLAYLLYQASSFRFSRSDPKIGVDLSREVMAKDAQARFLIETVEKATGCRVEFVFPSEKGHYYVDHDSSGNGLEFAREGKEDELLALLFGGKSYVQMGNDNTSPGEYQSSDVGDVLTLEHKIVDEPLDDEAEFELEFATGYGSGHVGSLKIGDEKIEGPFSLGWAGSVTEAMRGVTVTSATVGIMPPRFQDAALPPEQRRARDELFRWLSAANKVDEWRTFEEGEGPTDIRVLRNMSFDFAYLDAKPTPRNEDDARIGIRASASSEVVSKIREAFEATVDHVEILERRWAEEGRSI